MTAILSVVVLMAVAGWKVEQLFQNNNAGVSVVAGAAAPGHSGIPANNPSSDYGSLSVGSAASDPLNPSQITDNVATTLASEYALMQTAGTYSTTTANSIAERLGASIKADVSYKTYTASDIKTDPDTSYARMLTYRAALQTSLAPLMKSTTPELDILTSYVQTSNPKYLTELVQAADNYKLAATESALVVVPADAVDVQIGILNAMNEFGATISQMSASASDPFAEATLLNTYMQAQSDMFSSFDNLYAYYKSKQQ